ncbi:hypothetical protein BsWGS_15401 [Bradybaena similaris]
MHKTLSIVIYLLAASDGYFNVARGKPTKQIDTYPTPPTSSDLAVDGFTEMASHGCTHTAATQQTWWMVDFLRDYNIQAVNITNRPTMPERLQDFIVQVSKSNPLKHPGFPLTLPGEKCFHRVPQVPGTGSLVINCSNPITGRYLTVFKSKYNILAICELEAFGTDVPEMTMQLNSSANKKLNIAPLAVFHKVRSVLECNSLCPRLNNGTATAVQFNRRDGTCECIQFSVLVFTDSVFEDNPDWKLYLSKSN